MALFTEEKPIDITNFLLKGEIFELRIGEKFKALDMYNKFEVSAIASNYYRYKTNLFDIRVDVRNELISSIDVYFWNNEKYHLNLNKRKTIISSKTEIQTLSNYACLLNTNWEINQEKTNYHTLVHIGKVFAVYDLDVVDGGLIKLSCSE